MPRPDGRGKFLPQSSVSGTPRISKLSAYSLPILVYAVKQLQPLGLVFVRSGAINVFSGDHGGIARNALTWSASAVTFTAATGWGTALAHSLRIDATIIDPSNGDGGVRWTGYPLRCLSIG